MHPKCALEGHQRSYNNCLPLFEYDPLCDTLEEGLHLDDAAQPVLQKAHVVVQHRLEEQPVDPGLRHLQDRFRGCLTLPISLSFHPLEMQELPPMQLDLFCFPVQSPTMTHHGPCAYSRQGPSEESLDLQDGQISSPRRRHLQQEVFLELPTGTSQLPTQNEPLLHRRRHEIHLPALPQILRLLSSLHHPPNTLHLNRNLRLLVLLPLQLPPRPLHGGVLRTRHRREEWELVPHLRNQLDPGVEAVVHGMPRVVEAALLGLPVVVKLPVPLVEELLPLGKFSTDVLLVLRELILDHPESTFLLNLPVILDKVFENVVHRMMPRGCVGVGVVEVWTASIVHVLRPTRRKLHVQRLLGDPDHL
mmetsp:Transcript_4655/g.17514  ORF Transcript_4655/g.17514 Transcript_4655/m.17514 type:complete len:361 (+) Transcript_4655:1983-3065(+)